MSRAEVHAALAYYYENQAELDEAYKQAFVSSKQRGVVDSKEFEARIRARINKLQDE